MILFFRLASGLCLKLISVYILAYAWLILQGSSTQPSLSREGETAVSASRHRRIFVPLLFLCFRQRRFFLPYVDAAISTTCCCMLHSLKNPSIPHSSSLCVSLDFFFFSSLLCFWSEHPCVCLQCGFWIKVETQAVIRSLGDESAGRSPPFSSLPCQTCSHSSPQSERERERDVGKDPAVTMW